MILGQLWNRLNYYRKARAANRLSKLKLCFLIAASPNDAFYSQIAMFQLALNALGDFYQNARIVVVLGGHEIKPLPERWKSQFEKITIHWVSPEEFRKKSYLAQVDARWSYFTSESDFIIFADADTILLRPINELLEALIDSPAVAGTIAHMAFPQFPGDNPYHKWQSLADQLIGQEIPFEYTHTFATHDMENSVRQCPFYVNFGFIVFPYALAEQIRDSYLALSAQAAPHLAAPYFAGQVGLTLAIHAHDIPRRAIPLKYNFPNDMNAETLHPSDFQDIRVLHYLRENHFNRQHIFVSEEGFKHFLSLELSGSEKIFQGHIRKLTNSRYPF